MSEFVEFLKTMNTAAAQYVQEMEEIIYQDPSSALVKGRKFLEVLLDDITKYEEDLDERYRYFNLHEKISHLVKVGIIDGKKIQRAFDTVRMKGNVGAHHNETNEYKDAFTVHKEIYYIAVWYHDLYFYTENNNKFPPYESPKPQMESLSEVSELKQMLNEVQELLGDKLPLLKVKESTTIVTTEYSQDDNNKKQLKDDTEIEEIEEKEQVEKDNLSNGTEEILEKDLEKGQSYLIREISRLKSSSKEAIEGPEQFSRFKDYLHVERPILNDLEKILEERKDKENGTLILLCGNVGDGKSHILAYLKKNKPELLDNFRVYNDATESFSPSKDSLETLEESLSSFSDENVETNKENMILAINMGILHNFISREHKKYKYSQLKEFIEESKLFTSEVVPKHEADNYCLLSFGDYNAFELTKDGATSSFYSALLKKIVETSEKNPFYLALKEDEKNNVNTVVHENYKLLQNNTVQEQIIQLIIHSIITDKLVISARAFLDFIADILVPENSDKMIVNDIEKLELTLPNLLFNHNERSEILQSISKLDPINRRSEKTDQLVIALNTLDEWENVVKENVKDKVALKWLEPFFNQEGLTGYSFNLFFETFIRIIYLLDKDYADSLTESSYIDYLNYLYHFNRGDREQIIKFYEQFKKVLFQWKGSPKKDFVFVNKPTESYRIAQRLHLHPTIDHLKVIEEDNLINFQSTIILMYEDPVNKKRVALDIDYPLFKLFRKVKNGYRPSIRDEENAIQFTEFVDKILNFGEEKDELLIYFKSDDRLYSLKRGDFDAYVFERENN